MCMMLPTISHYVVLQTCYMEIWGKKGKDDAEYRADKYLKF